MKNTDISTLPLSSLFSGLSSLAENNRKSAAGRKGKGKKKALPPDKRPQVFRTKWTHQAVIMHTVISDCACCGHQFTTPEGGLLLRRTNSTVGTHLKEMQPGETYPDLPHETITRYTQVQACHLCFPLVQCVEHMQASDQLQLDLFDPSQDRYLTPPPPPEGRPQFTQPRAQSFVDCTLQQKAYHRPHEPEVTPSFTPHPVRGAWDTMLRKLAHNNDYDIEFYSTHPDIYPKEG